ncbi:chromatin accessibility complex protein 1-like [Gigantopelta aegis]|uniref:chromatin accessibility complex protein 1-like n=1 Tax=Gigantopelta aegis TaxID=1735272 RepID=UPI001B8882F8|nr:chromatin accessibility complex protein 1-like [Gigantopelta aegis]
MADKDKNSSTLPISRVKTIMKSSPDVSSISQEALHLTGRATELFIHELAKCSLERSHQGMSVGYSELADIVNSEETLQFLQDIIPRKIKVSEYYKMQEEEQT